MSYFFSFIIYLCSLLSHRSTGPLVPVPEAVTAVLPPYLSQSLEINAGFLRLLTFERK